MVDNTVSEITDALDHIIKDDIGGVIDSTFQQATALLHEFEQAVKDLLCDEEGIIKQLETFIGNSMLSTKSDCECVAEAAKFAEDSCAAGCTCGKKLVGGYKCPCSIASWEELEDQNAFYAMRCKVMKEIDAGLGDNKTVDWVVTKLSAVEDFAYQFHCYHFSDSALGDWYANQALALTQQRLVWEGHPEYAIVSSSGRARLTGPRATA